MKAVYSYENLENEVELMDDGTIEISLTDCAHASLSHTMKKEDAQKLFKAMALMFFQGVE